MKPRSPCDPRGRASGATGFVSIKHMVERASRADRKSENPRKSARKSGDAHGRARTVTTMGAVVSDVADADVGLPSGTAALAVGLAEHAARRAGELSGQPYAVCPDAVLAHLLLPLVVGARPPGGAHGRRPGAVSSTTTRVTTTPGWSPHWPTTGRAPRSGRGGPRRAGCR